MKAPLHKHGGLHQGDGMTATPSSRNVTPLIAAASRDSLVLTVAAKRTVADGVCELALSDPAGRLLPDWTPGSHIDVILPAGRVRQYSLCGDRWDPFVYRVAVLCEPHGRGGSAYVHDELRVGDRVPIGGPRNNFALVPAQRYLFIAGGIGIAPLLPMIEQTAGSTDAWSLVYAGRSRATMAFLDRLDRYGEHVGVWTDDCTGRVELDAVMNGLSADTTVYCCGPAGLLEAVEQRSLGWPAGRLRTERFVPAASAAPMRDTAFDVELALSGLTVTVHPGIGVLDALQAAGVTVLASCRRGVCGTCEIPVVDGIPDHRDSLLSDEERARNNCMFPCVSRSCSDRLVVDL
jgi:ferredoxin-NADP reductase